jgi:cell division protein FtsZ
MAMRPPVVAPAPAPAPVAYAPEPEVEVAQEPDLFAEPEAVADDGLPPPVYRPQPAPVMARAAPPQVNAAAETFVAPRPQPRAAGTPSPEVLARMKAAVAHAPGAAARAAAAPQAAAPAPKPAERSRFGIGSLINRMAGHLEEKTQGHAATPRVQPPVQAWDDDNEPSGDQDRIEIPAFLRRQAN